MVEAIPLAVKMREKHRGQGGYCLACRPRVLFPCEIMKLVIEHETLSSMVRTAKTVLAKIGTMSITRLDRRGET